MKQQKMLNTKKGITLIALVITIIVMLILVAVTISMAVNGGLFEYAGRAVGETQNILNVEKELSYGAIQIDGERYESIEKYIEKQKKVVANPNETFSKIYNENTTIKEENYTAVIPKGFAVGTSNGINTIKGGLVITDEVNDEGKSIGNEFVWIPVVLEGETQEEKKASFEEIRKDGYYTGSLQIYVSGKMVAEPFEGGYTDEVAEYNAMVESVCKNGGFYMGRYEAGSDIARNEKSNGTTEMVVKRDAYPYIYVGWGATMSDYKSNVICNEMEQGLGALALSKAMYANKDVGITSTLCYGLQWDAMLEFIGKETEKDSTTWGNYKDNEFTINRSTAKWAAMPSTEATWVSVGTEAKEKANTERILLTTGANDEFVEKNMFDLAGNVEEWTNEASTSADRRYYRGGDESCSDAIYPVTYRARVKPNNCSVHLGFRVTLYVNG